MGGIADYENFRKRQKEQSIISILENRLNDIEAAFNAVIEVTQQQSYSLAQFVVAAKSGLMALSTARDFLPYLTIKGNAT